MHTKIEKMLNMIKHQEQNSETYNKFIAIIKALQTNLPINNKSIWITK
jgi:hypothetical protein